jgi:hypothetical protein
MIITENAHQKAEVLTSRIIAKPAKKAPRNAAATAALEAARTAVALDRSSSIQHT